MADATIHHSHLNINEDEEKVFAKIEEDMKVKIPYHIKNVLVFCGYDTLIALAEIKQEDFIEMEHMIKKETSRLSRVRNATIYKAQFVDYYGKQVHRKARFAILPGHKKLILAIVKYIKENLLPDIEQNFPIIP